MTVLVPGTKSAFSACSVAICGGQGMAATPACPRSVPGLQLRCLPRAPGTQEGAALSPGPRRRAHVLRMRCVLGSWGLSARPQALGSQVGGWDHRTEAGRARATGQRPPEWLHCDSNSRNQSWRQAQGAARHRTSCGAREGQKLPAFVSLPHQFLLLGAGALHGCIAESLSSCRVLTRSSPPCCPTQRSDTGVGRSRRHPARSATVQFSSDALFLGTLSDPAG